MKYKITQPYPKIFVVKFNNHKALCDTFVRVSEYYEGVELKGTFFKKNKYLGDYKEKQGQEYFESWDGFNLSSSEIRRVYFSKKGREFFRKNPGEFDDYDNHILKIFRKCAQYHYSFYIIGISASSIDALDHELAHAFYCLDKSYRNKQYKRAMAVLKLYPEVGNHLKSIGYSENVLADELHAYMIDDLECLSGYINNSLEAKLSVFTGPFIQEFQKRKAKK